MNATLEAAPVLGLRARVAADLMGRDPVSLRAAATMAEAMSLFVDRGIDAAPVIDDSGRPIGVVSRSDVFIHLLESARGPGHQNGQDVPVADLMTPSVFSVAPQTPVAKIVRDMVGLHVHRLFVVDEGGVLIGVITAMDVLGCIET